MEVLCANAGPFVVLDDLIEVEINNKKDELDNVIRQLEAEVNEYIKKRLEGNGN